jgi:hypothetical protein
MERKKKEYLSKMELSLDRTVGLEIEGYMKKNPRKVIQEGGIDYCQIKHDGSLYNSGWHDGYGLYGCEIVTEPLNDLFVLKEVFEDITSHGWSASGRAGLHIHVDISDFTFKDKLKCASFAKSIEDIMFLFVRNRRYNNRYCHMMSKGWSDLESDDIQDVGINRFLESKSLHSIRENEFNVDRYNWINIFASHYPTIEFRLFHPIRHAKDGIKFSYLVHNFIDLVKNSTFSQLKFISESIHQESTVEAKASKFLEALDIPFELPVISMKARQVIEVVHYTKRIMEMQSV